MRGWLDGRTRQCRFPSSFKAATLNLQLPIMMAFISSSFTGAARHTPSYAASPHLSLLTTDKPSCRPGVVNTDMNRAYGQIEVDDQRRTE
jgi:hypothetical protein